MSHAIRNPFNPSDSRVEVFDDGHAVLKDGTKLSPASQNPWYVLATIAGEEKNALIFNTTSPEIRKANRRLWNAWMCQPLSSEGRSKLAKDMNFEQSDLAPITDDERHLIIEKFRVSFPDVVSPEESLIPNPHELVDFSETFFPNVLNISGFVFLGGISFKSCAFYFHLECNEIICLGNANFSNSVINGPISCRFSRFAKKSIFTSSIFDQSYFDDTTFSEYAHFDDCLFGSEASFTKTVFSSGVSFEKSAFSDHAKFDFTDFQKIAWFDRVTFKGYTSFMSACFSGPTVFRNSHFLKFVPVFAQCKTHADTRFSDIYDLWPEPSREDAEEGKQAYMSLRQIAAKNNNVDLEHFFLRQEMRCKEKSADNFSDKLIFSIYGYLSDFGISTSRPLIGLVIVVLSGWHLIGWHLKTKFESAHPGMESLAISIGNTIPFLGINARFEPDLYKDAPLWLSWLSSFQTIAGITLLFFLGLGLRNRFRLK